METKERLVEVRTAEGRPILSLLLTERQGASSSQDTAVTEGASQASGQASSDSSMTDAQKRYLFRILAEQGLEPDGAHERLKELFAVQSLQEVSKREASKMIEHLLEESESK